MLFDGKVPHPPSWATRLRWQNADLYVHRRRFVVRFDPRLVPSESAVNEVVKQLIGVSPVSLGLRYSDRMGTLVLDLMQEFEVGALLALLETAIPGILPETFLYVEPDQVHVALAEPDDEFAGDWPYSKIRAVEAWDLESGANPQITIGVIDTGIDLDNAGNVRHPDLDPARFDLGTNFVEPGSSPRDHNSHGTLVAGIAVAGRDNQAGIPGMTSATRVHVCKTLGNDAHGSESDFKRAVMEIVDKAVDSGRKVVINYSAGGTVGTQELKSACQYVESNGMLLCAAAGKSDGVLLFPAGFAQTIPAVIAVGGIDRDDSLFGPPDAEVFAPAIDIRSTKPRGVGSNDLYDTATGTSIATPFVTGLAALLWSRNPALTAAEVKQRILDSARVASGRRILDAAAALGA